VTNLWLFHRSAATTIVTAVAAGVPGYLAGTSHNGAAGTAYALLGSALAIGYNSVTSGIKQAFFYAFNTTVEVGDVIMIRADQTRATAIFNQRMSWMSPFKESNTRLSAARPMSHRFSSRRAFNFRSRRSRR
jgi:hypothetical protein